MQIESSSLGHWDDEEPWFQEKNSIFESSNMVLFDKSCSTSDEKSLNFTKNESFQNRYENVPINILDQKVSSSNYQINSLTPKNIYIDKTSNTEHYSNLSIPLSQNNQRIKDFQEMIKRREQGRGELKASQKSRLANNRDNSNNSDRDNFFQQNKNSQLIQICQRSLFPQMTHFILFGIINFDFQPPQSNVKDEDVKCKNASFKVLQLEKKHSRFFMQLTRGFFQEINKNSEWQKYDILIRSLEQQNNKVLYELGQSIKQLRIFYEQYDKHLQLIRIFYTNNENRLKNLQSLRIENMKNTVLKLKEELQFSPNDFVVALYFSPDFAEQIQSLHSIEINLAFMSLIGVSEDEFAAMVMRSGLGCWYESYSTEQFNNALVRGILSQQNYYEEVINDQRVRSFDDFSMRSSTQFIMIQNICENTHSYLPMALKPNLDFVVVMKYDISIHDIKQLLDLRRKQTNKDVVKELTSTVTYQIHSEVFLDKFYNSDPNKLKYPQQNQPLETFIEEEENEQINDENNKNNNTKKECGFREI